MKYSPKSMSQNLENNQFHFKKKFGQNFIVDENIVKAIVSKVDINRKTLIIEIGPGAGSLTIPLAQSSGQVLCYEIDGTLKEILRQNLIEYKNVDIIYDDFLTRNIQEDLKKYNYSTMYVVANLPYYITTPIITKIVEEQIPVSKIVVMVQKEVGDRFKAEPGTKEYGSLSVFLKYYFNVRKIMDISRNVFLPKPNVDSIVVEFTRKKVQEDVNEKILFKLIKDSFRQKRKTIKNNLKTYDLQTIETVLKKYNYDLTVRAENLSLDIFIALAKALS